MTRAAVIFFLSLALRLSADDTAALQALIDSTNLVTIPAGNYVSGALFVSSGKEIHGQGWQTVITAKTNIGAHLFSPKAMGSVASVSNVTIGNLKLSGHSMAQNGGAAMTNLIGSRHGIAILGGSGWTVTNVLSEDFDGDGIYLGRNFSNPASAPATGCLITDCVVRKNVRNGAMISHGIGNTIRRVLFEENQIGMVTNSPKYNPALYGSAGLDLEPNRITLNPLMWERVISNVVENCAFIRENARGIQIAKLDAPVRNNLIRSNLFLDCKAGAISLMCVGAIGTVIADNIFAVSSPSAATSVLRISNPSDVEIVRNQFLGGILPANNSRAVVINLASSTNHMAGIVFSDNLVDFSNSSGDGAQVYFGAGVEAPTIENNRLIGAKLDIR